MDTFLQLVAENYLWAIALAVVSFIQNMAFTASSRSRNSGNPAYHFRIAVISNGIWFVCHLLVWSQIWTAVKALREADQYLLASGLWLAIVAAIYVTATSLGSSYMMSIMLRKEHGDKRVGHALESSEKGGTLDIRVGDNAKYVTSYGFSHDGLRLVCAKCSHKSHYPELREGVEFVVCKKCGHVHALSPVPFSGK